MVYVCRWGVSVCVCIMCVYMCVCACVRTHIEYCIMQFVALSAKK